jgi:hypothetical protein
VALAFSCVFGATAAPPVVHAPDERVDHWREDLAYLAKELPAKHKNLFFAQSKEEFEGKVSDLDAMLDQLDDDEVVARLMQLVASVGDGHTSLNLGSGDVAWKTFGVQFHPFPDGLRVVLAPNEQANVLGAKVVSVGGVPFADAWKRVSEAVSHDNEPCVAARAPLYFESPFVLHGLGLGHDSQHASFVVQKDDGTKVELDLAAGRPLRTLLAEAKEPPLWRQQRDQNYWWKHVPESKLLYLQFNRCTDDPSRPFAKVVDELFACADQNDVEHLFVDLRHNGGGNSQVMAPLLKGLASRGKLHRKGVLFAAIGASTFSSAMLNALDLRNGFGALLVGEPTGGKPNGYGEIVFLHLPHSKLEVTCSTKYFHLVDGDPPSVEPDVAAPITWPDWRDGKDPALAAALAWKPASAK